MWLEYFWTGGETGGPEVLSLNTRHNSLVHKAPALADIQQWTETSLDVGKSAPLRLWPVCFNIQGRTQAHAFPAI